VADGRTRGDSKTATNDWLSPPELVHAAALGDPFDLDPATLNWLLPMPWRTAKRMIRWGGRLGENPHVSEHVDPDDLVGDGLAMAWHGNVWLNPPWDDPLPWAEKMAAHGNGMMLTSAKSTDTRWAQVILANATAVLFFRGRLLYHYPDGTKSTGAWTPSMLAAFGQRNVPALARVQALYPGVILARA
jgi:hypothetical protein